MGVYEYGADVLSSLELPNVVLVNGECSQDIEARFSLNVYVICVCFEQHSECGGRDGVGYVCVERCCGL